MFSEPDQAVQQTFLRFSSVFPCNLGNPEFLPVPYPITDSYTFSVILSSLAKPLHCLISISSTLLCSASYPLCCPFLEEDLGTRRSPGEENSTKWPIRFMASTAGEGNYSGTWVRNTEKELLTSSWVCPLMSFCLPKCPSVLVRVFSSVVRGSRHALGWTQFIGEKAPWPLRWNTNYTCS